MRAICGSVGLAAGAAMAPANPNASPTDAAAAMVLYMVLAFVLSADEIRVQDIGWLESGEGSRWSKKIQFGYCNSPRVTGTFWKIFSSNPCRLARTSVDQLHD